MKSAILLLILWSLNVCAQTIEEQFAAKDYAEVSRIYRDGSLSQFSTKELVMISYALRKEKDYRSDIKLNIYLVKKDFQEPHKKLLQMIKKGDTVDGDEFPEPLKILYWTILNDYTGLLKEYSQASPALKKDQTHFTAFYKILSALEFRESKVEKLNDTVSSHFQYLENKVFKFSKSLSFQYVTWQQEAFLISSNNKIGLITTNKGYCLGGEAGLESHFYHFYVDGCFLFGSGAVAAPDSTVVTYQQSNIPAFGIKAGPGASMIVSSSKSRVGIKLPLIYSTQKLTNPQDPTYLVKEGSALSILASLYSRWQFDKWYIQTEFGKYLKQNETFWGLGLGKNF